MGRVEPERGQDRKDEVRKELLEEDSLRRRQVAKAHQLDAVPGELRQDLLQQQRPLLLLARTHSRADLGQLLRRCPAVGRETLRPALLLQLQSPDPLHEELVEVAAEDGDELEPLEERNGRILRLGQNPGVELEPRELAIEEGRCLLRGVRRPALGFRLDPDNRLRHVLPASAVRFTRTAHRRFRPPSLTPRSDTEVTTAGDPPRRPGDAPRSPKAPRGVYALRRPERRTPSCPRAAMSTFTAGTPTGRASGTSIASARRRASPSRSRSIAWRRSAAWTS